MLANRYDEMDNESGKCVCRVEKIRGEKEKKKQEVGYRHANTPMPTDLLAAFDATMGGTRPLTWCTSVSQATTPWNNTSPIQNTIHRVLPRAKTLRPARVVRQKKEELLSLVTES